MDHPATPTVLLAEDDPVSFAFLAESLRGLGFEVQGAADGEAALKAAGGHHFDLLMLDHHLPGLDGDAVLRALRADAVAASRTAIAIATTAEPDPAVHACLREAGFARVLAKPLDVAHLREALRQLGIGCAQNLGDHISPLDDGAGMRASGNAEALTALRGLFARELDTLASEWIQLRADDFALASRLHRLRAACGFCGALVLQSAADNLSTALRQAEPARVEVSRTEFQRALELTREALRR
ncbi:MAG: response regulator [Rhodanobacteraceae bacterium]